MCFLNVTLFEQVFFYDSNLFFYRTNSTLEITQDHIKEIHIDKDYMELVWDNIFSSIKKQIRKEEKVTIHFSKKPNFSTISVFFCFSMKYSSFLFLSGSNDRSQYLRIRMLPFSQVRA